MNCKWRGLFLRDILNQTFLDMATFPEFMLKCSNTNSNKVNSNTLHMLLKIVAVILELVGHFISL